MHPVLIGCMFLRILSHQLITLIAIPVVRHPRISSFMKENGEVTILRKLSHIAFPEMFFDFLPTFILKHFLLGGVQVGVNGGQSNIQHISFPLFRIIVFYTNSYYVILCKHCQYFSQIWFYTLWFYTLWFYTSNNPIFSILGIFQ